MNITRISIYVHDVERMKDFYMKYFDAELDDTYENFQKGTKYTFLKFDEGSRIALVTAPDVQERTQGGRVRGISHFAISLPNALMVRMVTSRLMDDGYQVVNGVRYTGYGKYESRVLDPEGNEIELTTEGFDEE